MLIAREKYINIDRKIWSIEIVNVIETNGGRDGSIGIKTRYDLEGRKIEFQLG
jgi:hypothetical protein